MRQGCLEQVVVGQRVHVSLLHEFLQIMWHQDGHLCVFGDPVVCVVCAWLMRVSVSTPYKRSPRREAGQQDVVCYLAA